MREAKKANDPMQGVYGGDNHLVVTDLVLSLLGPDGLPVSDLFVKDSFSLHARDYDIWSSAPVPVRQKILAFSLLKKPNENEK